MCGARLACRGDVRVVTGPVVGRVDASSAIVLLELDVDADVTFALCLVDANCLGGREISRTVSTRSRGD